VAINYGIEKSIYTLGFTKKVDDSNCFAIASTHTFFITNEHTFLAIANSITYLLNNTLRDSSGVHWKGGVFFSGGTVVRKTLFWKSDAYNYGNYFTRFC
jgi:hypothetical protein